MRRDKVVQRKLRECIVTVKQHNKRERVQQKKEKRRDVPNCQLGRWEPVLSERGFSIGQDPVVSQYPEGIRY